MSSAHQMNGGGFWILCGCVVIVLLYCVNYGVFVDEENVMVATIELDSERDMSAAESSASAADIFDYCPFEPPDPWDKSIVKYIDDKYGFIKNCTPNATLEPVTSLVRGAVWLKKGNERFHCQARCIDYASDNKYKLSKWKPIKKSTFKCDFVETKCSLGNITKRYIHMQIVEQKDEVKNKLDWRIMPDVHLLVIDSVASPQIIRGLPRTINFFCTD